MKHYKILLAFVLTVILLAACGESKTPEIVTPTPVVTPIPTIDPAIQKAAEEKAQADAAEKSQKDEEAKLKAAADAKAKADKEAKVLATAEYNLKNPKWNTSEVNPMDNGNIPLAIDMINKIKNIPAGQTTPAAKVIKAPWTYYGKPIIFSGTAAVVDDYPPDSDFGNLGLASEIVIESDDGTIVDFFSMVPSGDIAIGDYVTITAYPVGRLKFKIH